ncbi:MAG: hypothetical protein NW200_07200 [Hyphomonadaceae bacterium]|nr:hypothetical protein [Hyphomonadaceae bacterium]
MPADKDPTHSPPRLARTTDKQPRGGGTGRKTVTLKTTGAGFPTPELATIRLAASHASAVADAFANLQRAFGEAILRHEPSGAVRIQVWRDGAIEWSPAFERGKVGFDITFGNFRFIGEQRLTDDQMDALTEYAATVEAPAVAPPTGAT